ncbi:MMPL family transporter [Streptomyces sp. L7]
MQTTIKEDLARAEMIALPVTLLLLVMVFGSAIAALLPLGIGIVAILGTNAVLRGLTEFTDVSVLALNLTTALGLGLAIDYALFIVRAASARNCPPAPSRCPPSPPPCARPAVRCSSRASTVAVSLAAMLVFPMYFPRAPSPTRASPWFSWPRGSRPDPPPRGPAPARPPGQLPWTYGACSAEGRPARTSGARRGGHGLGPPRRPS